MKRRFPNRENREYLHWMRYSFPCDVCTAADLEQESPTEVEHWITKSRGGYDKGDTFPTCARHRQERHTWGQKTFQARYPQRDWSSRGAYYVSLYEDEFP